VHELFTAPFGSHPVLWPFNFLMQIIEFVAKTVSHGMRLFGNMYAGELIFMLIALMGGAFSLSATGIGRPMSPPSTPDQKRADLASFFSPSRPKMCDSGTYCHSAWPTAPSTQLPPATCIWSCCSQKRLRPLPWHSIVAMMVRICGLWWINPCRILRRCDSEHTHGFVYGTLPEHAECGEEQFVIERRPDGSVWYVIRAFSHPRHWMAWIAFPLARWWQCRFVRDSQRRMQQALQP
jgi:hypothetical protein